MGRFVSALVAVAILILLDFILVWLGVDFVLNPLSYFVVFFCLDWLFSVFSRRTDVVVIQSKGLLVKRFGQYTVVKSSDGRIFANRSDWPIKVETKKLDAVLKVGCKYKIVSYKQICHSDRNILFATEIKSSVRKKSGKKSK